MMCTAVHVVLIHVLSGTSAAVTEHAPGIGTRTQTGVILTPPDIMESTTMLQLLATNLDILVWRCGKQEIVLQLQWIGTLLG
jgi:hypothetical protein